MQDNLGPINIFDFDGTLTTETWPKFLVWIKKFGYIGEKRNDDLEKAIAEYRQTHSGTHLETFFGFFCDLLIKHNQTLTIEELMEGEQYIQYNPGVIEYIEKSHEKNYIVSGGFIDFLQNLKISKHFDGIYGTTLKHNRNGLISGIDEIMTDDKKILAIKHILKSNNREDDNCKNVYYIGDGYSDLIAMRFVHDNGGKAIFVHQPNQNDELFNHNQKTFETLNNDGRIDLCCVAEYREGSDLLKALNRNMEQ